MPRTTHQIQLFQENTREIIFPFPCKSVVYLLPSSAMLTCFYTIFSRFLTFVKLCKVLFCQETWPSFMFMGSGLFATQVQFKEEG